MRVGRGVTGGRVGVCVGVGADGSVGVAGATVGVAVVCGVADAEGVVGEAIGEAGGGATQPGKQAAIRTIISAALLRHFQD